MKKEMTNRIVSSLIVLSIVLSSLAMLPLVSAADATIWGSVRDTSLNPINGAEVTLTEVHTLKQYHTVTTDGMYEFTPDIGYYTIEVKADGYFSQMESTPIRFDGTETLRYNFNLDASPEKNVFFHGFAGVESPLTSLDLTAQFAAEYSSVTGEDVSSTYQGGFVYLAHTNIVSGSYTVYWNGTILAETANYTIDLATGEISVLNTTISDNLASGVGTMTVDYDWSTGTTVIANNPIMSATVTMSGGTYDLNITSGEISVSGFIFGVDTITVDYTYADPVVPGATIEVIAVNGTSTYFGEYEEVIGSAITDANGGFSIPVWADTFVVKVTAEGYYTFNQNMFIDGASTTPIALIEANTVHGYVYIATESGDEPANNITAYLYNEITGELYSTTGSSYYYSFSEGVPAGTYLLIIDADGGVAYTGHVNITGTTTPLPDASGEVTLAPADAEEVETTITLTDWNTVEMKKSMMLNIDGNIAALGNDVSNVWLQIDMKLGNGDGKINQTEVNAFVDWYNSIGPEYVTTAGFFEVNGTYYISSDNLTDYLVTVEPTISGAVNVTEMGGMWINTTVQYVSADSIGEQDVYTSVLYAQQDVVGADTINSMYILVLPSGYELVDNSSSNSAVSGYTTITIDPSEGSGSDTVSMTFEKSEAPVVHAGLKESGSVYPVTEDGNISYYIVKAGAEVVFTATGTEDPNANPVTYEWNFGDGTTETTAEKDINHTYTSLSADITVTMTATDAGGLSNSTTISIKVDGVAPTPAATSSITPVAGKIYADQGEDIIFNGSTSNDGITSVSASDGIIKSWFWWFGDNDSALILKGEEQNVTKSFTDVGTYLVYLNVTDVVGNYRNTSIFTVQINDTEGPAISFVVLDDTFVDAKGSVKENSTAYFDASGTTDNMDSLEDMTFFWNFGDGTNATGVNVSHNYSAIGSYEVNLTVTDSSGNTNSFVKTVVVRAANRPDLSIVSVKFDPIEFEQGQTGKIIVNITNNGEANATGIKVTAYIVDIDGNEEEIGSTSTITLNGTAIGQLEVGKIATAEIDWKPSKTGNFTIKIVVSADDELSATATNNVYTDVVSVAPSKFQSMLTWIGILALIIILVVLLIFRNRLSSIKVGGGKKKK